MIEEALDQFLHSRLVAKLGPDYVKFRSYIIGIIGKNKEHFQILGTQETKIKELEKKCSDQKNSIDELNNRVVKFEARITALEKQCEPKGTINNIFGGMEKPDKARNPAQTIAADTVINQFNIWAANPALNLPGTFTFLLGDFKIRTNQQLVRVPTETKWITNRVGAKKYLLPNPKAFNQMTNILELYQMDLYMLKEKGKNRIKIITPCEISSSGFVEFSGKLQILP